MIYLGVSPAQLRVLRAYEGIVLELERLPWRWPR